MLLVGIFGVRAAFAGPPALDVTVASVQGEVHVTAQARQLDVHKGDVVPLPTTIYTGPSGSIELRQGNTTLSAAPNSQLVIPAPAIPGEAIDRVIQSRGNAFYNVAKRGASKLHVESAYLVAVIKGTQFSVVAQDDSATISLFEGRLEVRATDGSDVVDLQAGEIAVRHANDNAIRMLRMDTGEPVAHRAPPVSPESPTSGAGLAPGGSSNPTTVGGDAGDLRGASADSGAESSPGLGSAPTSFTGGVPNLGNGSTGISDVVAANLGNKSANGGANPGNGHSNGQGASNNGSGQGTSSNGNGQGAGNNSNGQSASNNGNGQGSGNNGNGQSAGGNNGNGQGASNSGNGQSAGNNGNGQGSGNNGNGQNASNNGNGQNNSNNGNGHRGSNKAASGRSLSLGNGLDGLAVSGTLNRGITSPLTQTTGANLGIGAPSGGAANSNPLGGLLGSVTRHKGSSVQP